MNGVRSDRSFQKPQTPTKKQVHIYAKPKTTNIRLFTVNENSLARSLWEAKRFFNLFLYKPLTDICSKALNILKAKASFKIQS